MPNLATLATATATATAKTIRYGYECDESKEEMKSSQYQSALEADEQLALEAEEIQERIEDRLALEADEGPPVRKPKRG